MPKPQNKRRDGHRALRSKDGKIDVFDPHPGPRITDAGFVESVEFGDKEIGDKLRAAGYHGNFDSPEFGLTGAAAKAMASGEMSPCRECLLPPKAHTIIAARQDVAMDHDYTPTAIQGVTLTLMSGISKAGYVLLGVGLGFLSLLLCLMVAAQLLNHG